MTPTPARHPPFSKPWKSYEEQVALLQSRGLVIANIPAAIQFLSHVNYYRFSGYCLPFEPAPHAFRPGTTFEQVQAAYDFDRLLRDFVTEGLEAIEVDLRTTVAYSFGQKYGAFGHTDAGNFFRRFDHANWLAKLHEEAERSNEAFVTHFRDHYCEFPDLPVWVITEVMSFGALSKMYHGMLKRDQKVAASRYGLQPEVLESWMHHMAYVRNLCAHHSRLWDRAWSIKPRPAYGNFWQPPYLPGNDRLFITLLLLNVLMVHCPAIAAFAADWRTRVQTLLDQPPAVPNASDLMGLSATWRTHPLWR